MLLAADLPCLGKVGHYDKHPSVGPGWLTDACFHYPLLSLVATMDRRSNPLSCLRPDFLCIYCLELFCSALLLYWRVLVWCWCGVGGFVLHGALFVYNMTYVFLF